MKYGILTILVFLGLADQAFAEVQADNLLDGVIQQYRYSMSQFVPVIRFYASQLFWIIALMEITWTGMEALLSGDNQPNSILARITRQLLTIGFFWNIVYYSDTWCSAIIESFREIAGKATQSAGGTSSLSPSEIFDSALILVDKITEQVSFFAPGESTAIVISAIVILISFASVSAFTLVALIEMYFALGVGVLVLGLGSSRFTNDYSKRYLGYIVSIGMKLMVLQLLVGTGQTFIIEWTENFDQHSSSQIMVLIGASLVMLILVKTVPDSIQSLINGASFTSGGGSMLAGMAAGGMAGAAGMASSSAGAGLAVREAAKVASSEGGALGSRLKTMGSSLGSAFKADVLGKMSGNPSARSGTLGGRMASNIKQGAFDRASENSISFNDKSESKETKTTEKSIAEEAFEETAFDMDDFDTFETPDTSTNDMKPGKEK